MFPTKCEEEPASYLYAVIKYTKAKRQAVTEG